MTEEMPRYTVFLDPGKATGVAVLDFRLGKDPQHTAWEGNLVSVGDFLLDRVDDPVKPVIGWERYLGSGGTASWSHEMIGVARYLALTHGCRVIEAPAASRVIASDKALKIQGWYRSGKPHANDASRHLAAWLLREGLWTVVPGLQDMATSLL